MPSLWDSRDTKYDTQNDINLNVLSSLWGNTTLKLEPFADPQKVLMPPLHINLRLRKRFGAVLEKEYAVFKHLQHLSP